jgi:pyridoxine 5-phosphate synthase
MNPTKLSVNLNKVAWLRNARDGSEPDPCYFGEIALKAGAAGLTVHPRPDERHIRAADVPAIAAVVRRFPGREYNIEGNPFRNLMGHLEQSRPDQATFVPDADSQKTSDHGFDLTDEAVCSALRPLIAKAKSWGCRVSIFMDPVPDMMAKAKELGADRIELYTEGWAKAFGTPREGEVLARYAASARAALASGLGVNAGHDLSLKNLGAFLKGCPGVSEVSIGQALTAEALEFGMAETVRRYVKILDEAAR